MAENNLSIPPMSFLYSAVAREHFMDHKIEMFNQSIDVILFSIFQRLLEEFPFF